MELFEGMGLFEWGVLGLLVLQVYFTLYVFSELEKLAVRKVSLLEEIRDKLATTQHTQ